MFKNLLFGLLFFIFGCNNSTDTKDSTVDLSKQKNETYQIKELQIYNGEEEGWGADIRLSIVSATETDTSKLYTAISTYEGRQLGLLISTPKKKEGSQGFSSGIILKTIGIESDFLLQTIAKLYKQKIDTNFRFTKVLSMTYVNLDEFAKSLEARDGGDYKTENQYKLFYEGNEEGDYAEIYLNINATENWIELREKDEEYRPVIIKILKQ